MFDFDAIVIGGGPAGLAAALTLGRSRRRALLLDAGQGRNAPAAAVHNVLGHDGTGLRDELPAIDGLAALWGRSAFHCPYCHGFEVSGRRLAVLGAGPERVRLALQLTGFTGDLVLCADGEPLPRHLAEPLAAAGVAVRGEPVRRFEGAGGRLERIVLEGGAPLERDAVFIPTVLRQGSDLAERLGCALLPDGCVEVDELARTSVPGVYAAGDMAHRAALPRPFAAVSAAAASGALAGAMVDQDLLATDFPLPAPAGGHAQAGGSQRAARR
jgi:thioredoxin reductase